MADDHTVVDHQRHVLEHREIGEWIPVHHQQVGDLPLLEGAEQVIDPAHAGGIAGRGDDDLHGRQSGVLQGPDLVVVTPLVAQSCSVETS